jgi:hypothetical protein
MMKDCVARERAGDSSISESQARKACHDALKDEKADRDDEVRDQPRPREPQ